MQTFSTFLVSQNQTAVNILYTYIKKKNQTIIVPHLLGMSAKLAALRKKQLQFGDTSH